MNDQRDGRKEDSNTREDLPTDSAPPAGHRQKDPIFQLCDVVRETGYAVHRWFRHGHFEKVYENSLVNRLRKKGIDIRQQLPIPVYDEDGTLVGDYDADALVENQLLIEMKALKALTDDHVAQLLGYLRGSRLEHGLLINFGAPKFQIKKLILSKERFAIEDI